MRRFEPLAIVILRVVVGWYFLYAGITALLNPSWSIVSYIQQAATFPAFYQTIAASSMIASLSYAAKGLFILIGACLILGIFVRLTSFLGILLSLFFYFPLLHFPSVSSPGNNVSYIVDDHIIIAAALFLLFAVRAGKYFGLGSRFKIFKY